METENIRTGALADAGLESLAVLSQRTALVMNGDAGMGGLVLVDKRLHDSFGFVDAPVSERGLGVTTKKGRVLKVAKEKDTHPY